MSDDRDWKDNETESDRDPYQELSSGYIRSGQKTNWSKPKENWEDVIIVIAGLLFVLGFVIYLAFPMISRLFQ